MKTQAISHPRAITTIREPIHGAIDITCYEREVIDSPYYQRLHFVLQNSTTYTAYPSNKNSRFVHSLGVSYVCGEMLISALRNAPKGELLEFLAQAADFVFALSVEDSSRNAKSETIRHKRLVEGWKRTILGHSRFAHRSFLPTAAEPLCDEDVNNDDLHGFEIGFLVDTLWEAVRICGLAHDIGHLPMSHSFEMALLKIDELLDQYPGYERQSQANSIDDDAIVQPLVSDHHDLLEKFSGIDRDQLANFLLDEIEVHERRSLMILQYIIEADAYGHEDEDKETETGEYRDLVFSLALLILYASSADNLALDQSGKTISDPPKFPAFVRVLKTIVAGEVDGDRMDYTIRDGHACGSEIGIFDIQRVISNAVLRKHEDRFRIMYYERAISGLEHFFVQRHDGYKYLIYHRTSSRTEACLQELLGRLLHAAVVCPGSLPSSVLFDFGYITVDSNKRVEQILPFSRDAMASLDDSNLRTMFMILRKKMASWKPGEDDFGLTPELIWPIRSLLDIVCVRDFDSIMSPYKNFLLVGQMVSTAEALAKKDQLSESLVGLDEAGYSALVDEAFSVGSMKSFADKLRRRFAEATDGAALLLVSFQKPKLFSSASVKEHDWLYVIEHSGNVAPLAERSRLLKSMSEFLKRSSGVTMSILSVNVKASADEMNRLRQTLNTVLFEALSEYKDLQSSLKEPEAT